MPPHQLADHDYSYPYEVAFVTRVAWKGVHESLVVTFMNPIFDTAVGRDDEYLVFAMGRSNDDRLYIMGCGLTTPVERAAQDIHDLGAPNYVYQESPDTKLQTPSAVSRVAAPESCSLEVDSLQARIMAATAVFVGRVDSVWGPSVLPPHQLADHDYSFAHEVAFVASVAWKGVHEPLVITFNNPIFQVDAQPNQPYLVFATRSPEDGRLYVNGCGDITPLRRAARAILHLGAPTYEYHEPALSGVHLLQGALSGP
jgi:hypothetical protein